MRLSRFYDLVFDWGLDRLLVRRKGQVMLEISETCEIFLTVEAEDRRGMEHFALLRLRASRFEWLFFVDYDGVQTSMREIDPYLKSLREVLDWLLPQDYIQRQGDVGIYGFDLASTAVELPDVFAVNSLRPVLKDRHVLKSSDPLRYFECDGAVVVQSTSTMRMLHPEHPAQEMAPGAYKFVAASGVAYPILQNVRSVGGSPLTC